MTVDVVIKNCRVVSPEGISAAGVAIDDGVIVAIASDPNLPEAKRTIDAKGNYLLPGIIDAHTHFGVYRPLVEDLKNTEAAVCGGVTYHSERQYWTRLRASSHSVLFGED